MRNSRQGITNHLMWFMVLFVVGIPARSQTSDILDSYIRQGIGSNIALQQKELNLEKSLQALKEANGLFYPTVGIEAQYYLAHGGRTIDLPVGDMLNPAYQTLNGILQAIGQPQQPFPVFENESIEFLPNDYHETKVRIITPLINTEIYYNRKIKKENISASQAEVNVFKRELIRNIKVAYFEYLQSMKAVEAYSNALELVNEYLRVNKKLVENQKAGPEVIYRMEAEVSKVNADLVTAENRMNMAASRFNFLLNQPLKNPVLVDSLLLNRTESVGYLPAAFELSKREEVDQLNSVSRSADYYYKMKKNWFIPSVTNITDLGYQGYQYTFDHDQQYAMNIVSLSWPIFTGFQNRSKIAQARIQNETLRNQLVEVENYMELESRLAQAALESSMKSEEACRSSLKSSEEYFRIVRRQYENGLKSLLDLIDARTELTNANIKYSLAHFETLKALASLERANASYDLNIIH